MQFLSEMFAIVKSIFYLCGKYSKYSFFSS
jgi:hypothetical protein